MATIPAYSRVLWEFGPSSGSGQLEPSPPVPAGFVWVVREIAASNPTVIAGYGLNSLQFLVNGFVVFRTPVAASTGSVPYTYRDTRWVAAAGEQLAVISTSPGWMLRASGFVLTA